MSWMDTIGQPLCPNPEEAVAYMTAELARAVPEGWMVERFPDPGFRSPSVPRMSWRVSRRQVPQGEWSDQSYDVRLSASLEFVIFTYGSNDIGCGSLDQSLQPARVIEAWELRRYGMPACLEHVITNCKPNQWGYT